MGEKRSSSARSAASFSRLEGLARVASEGLQGFGVGPGAEPIVLGSLRGRGIALGLGCAPVGLGAVGEPLRLPLLARLGELLFEERGPRCAHLLGLGLLGVGLGFGRRGLGRPFGGFGDVVGGRGLVGIRADAAGHVGRVDGRAVAVARGRRHLACQSFGQRSGCHGSDSGEG
jgi:hypothetical protein